MAPGRRIREISVSQEALILKNTAHTTCVIVDKARGHKSLTNPEKTHLARHTTAILNAVLLNYGTVLSEFMLQYALREMAGRIVQTIADEHSLNFTELRDLMRDLMQDVEILSQGRWLSFRRASELLQFWRRFHELAEAIEAEGVHVLRSPV